MGVYITNSASSINLAFSTIVDHVEHGIRAFSSSNMSILNDLVVKVVPSLDSTPVMETYTGWTGGITMSETVSATKI